jgi:Holliday junction resolvase RusA-like endonuclease
MAGGYGNGGSVGEGDSNDEQGVYTFIIPDLPPSVNSLHQVIWSQRKVELKPEVRLWRSQSKPSIPRLRLTTDSLLNVDLTFHYRQHCKNGKLRRLDTHNCVKVILDLIAEKCGFDDSRVKSGSWSSVDDVNERVEVRLREIVSE